VILRYGVTTFGFGCRGFFGFSHRGTPLNVRQASWPMVGNFRCVCVKERAISSKTFMICFVQRVLLPASSLATSERLQLSGLMQVHARCLCEAQRRFSTVLGGSARWRFCYTKI